MARIQRIILYLIGILCRFQETQPGSMKTTIHFIVTGRVQGVFFRASCKKEADRLAVTGWVRNLPDGRVEGMASAAPEGLQAFQQWLNQGPPLAKVSNLQVSDQPEQQFDRFEIR